MCGIYAETPPPLLENVIIMLLFDKSVNADICLRD